jgi:enamine deaminase RidA (YjgF/YER057c/UK114 family)
MKKELIATFDATGTGMSGAEGMISANCYRAGNLVFITGQTGITLDGKLVGVGDPAAQARQACENIKALIEMAGGTMDDIVKTITYVADPRYRETAYPMIRSFFTAETSRRKLNPCGTGIVVAGLARPELLVEIDAWGFIDDPD